ncbi:MAG: PduL/EutD family phosphate acyltransferase [bacterium]
MGALDAVEQDLAIPIAVSARHIHLSPEAVEVLFGPGHTLTPLKELSQPGQYACVEQLDPSGPRRNYPGRPGPGARPGQVPGGDLADG